MQEIQRELYKGKISFLIGKPLIKVITGQRRVGKSTLLRHLIQQFTPSETLFLDCEQKEVLDDIQRIWLSTYVKQNAIKTKKCLCVDEIQKIRNREIDIVSLFNQFPHLEIWITGSNSDILASDLTTNLRWRYCEINVYPFSYTEFCLYFQKKTSAESFVEYVQYGWYPWLYLFLDNQEMYKQLSKSLVDTTFMRDIVERYKIHDIHLLDTLFLYLVNTTGQYFSPQAFLQQYSNTHTKTTFITIQQYVEHLVKAYLLYPVDARDIQGKKIIQRQKKYYIADHSRRKTFFSHFDPWQGKELENIVYLEARRQGRDVFVGKTKDKEVDFIIQKWQQRKYIQVCYFLATKEVVQREFGNLEAIKDNYPKIVISLDPLLHTNTNGIQHIQIWEMDRVFDS